MISKVIHHAMVAEKIYASTNDFPKQVDHQEKTNEKDWVMQDAKPFDDKDSRPNGGKNKDIISYKGQNPQSDGKVSKGELMFSLW